MTSEFEKQRGRVAKSNICYFDNDGNVCEKGNAVTCIITEYDEDGNLLNSVHGIVDAERYKRRSENKTNSDDTMWSCPLCKTFNPLECKYCSTCGYHAGTI